MRPAFSLPSPETGTDYAIYVVAPRAAASPGPWPVVIFLDGDDQFSFAVATYRQLRKAREIPPLLLVGVGYGASYTKPGNKRGRDYTPTTHSDEPTSGGGEVFLRFLQRTLWPELARRFPVHAESRGIAGHSLGSLLVLHALWREPTWFTHYLASAPSIWWDDRAILRLAAQYRVRHATLRAQLFLGVGTEDSISMLGDLALLEQQLAAKSFRELRVTSQRFQGKNHFDALPEAFRAGLLALFGDASPPV